MDRNLLLPVLTLIYPVVCHLSVLSGYPQAALAWLGLLLAGIGLRNPSLWGRLLSLGGAALVALALLPSSPLHTDVALRAAPVAMTTGLAILFGETLLPGRTALIVRIAERFRGTLSPKVALYGRRLTLAWALLFVALAVEATLLGFFASPFWWSWFTNFANYLIVGGFFFIEYQVRQRILSDVSHQPFIEYLGSMIRTGFRA